MAEKNWGQEKKNKVVQTTSNKCSKIQLWLHINEQNKVNLNFKGPKTICGREDLTWPTHHMVLRAHYFTEYFELTCEVPKGVEVFWRPDTHDIVFFLPWIKSNKIWFPSSVFNQKLKFSSRSSLGVIKSRWKTGTVIWQLQDLYSTPKFCEEISLLKILHGNSKLDSTEDHHTWLHFF